MLRLLGFILLSSISCNETKSQQYTYADIREKASKPDFFLRKSFDYKLRDSDSLNVSFILKPFDGDGLFTQQYCIPVMENYVEKLSYNVYYYFDSTSFIVKNDGIIFNESPDIQEIKVQLSIKEIFPELHLKYLLNRGEHPFEDWEEIAIKTGVNVDTLKSFISNKKVENLLFESFEKSNNFRKQHADFLELLKQNLACFSVNGTINDGKWLYDLMKDR